MTRLANYLKLSMRWSKNCRCLGQLWFFPSA